MKLAFYYHIPLTVKKGEVYAPSFIGVFIEELAKQVTELILVFHEANESEQAEADYQILAKNIKLVDLGKKTPAWHRSFFPRNLLKSALKELETCDAFLIRSPTPLAAAFNQYLKNPICFFMIVGDYAEGAKQLGSKGIKNKLLRLYFTRTDKKFKTHFPNTALFVNSPQLFEQYKDLAQSITLIKTTTLRASDFFIKERKVLSNPVQLLYTGRIEITKGLLELIDATHQLIQNKNFVHLNIVGWENNPAKPFEKQLIERAKSLGIEEYITFHGKQQVGEALNRFYREADLYVLPSHHEGFPRTLWEAMANSLPIISTKVGGIPHYLTHNEHALLIDPKSVDEIVKAVENLIKNEPLREHLVKNAFHLVKENALDKQTFLLVQAIKDQIK